MFADLERFPRRQVFRFATSPGDLIGYQGAAEYDFVKTAFRPGPNGARADKKAGTCPRMIPGNRCPRYLSIFPIPKENDPMKILYLNNDGAGFADYVEIAEGTTVTSFFAERVPHGKPQDYLIRVNRQPVRCRPDNCRRATASALRPPRSKGRSRTCSSVATRTCQCRNWCWQALLFPVVEDSDEPDQ